MQHLYTMRKYVFAPLIVLNLLNIKGLALKPFRYIVYKILIYMGIALGKYEFGIKDNMGQLNFHRISIYIKFQECRLQVS